MQTQTYLSRQADKQMLLCCCASKQPSVTAVQPPAPLKPYETRLADLFKTQDEVEGCLARQAARAGHTEREDTYSHRLKWQLYRSTGCQRDQMRRHICRPADWQGPGMRLGVCPLAPSASIPSAPLAVQPCRTGADTVSVSSILQHIM